MEEFAIGANLESAAARRNERERLDALAQFKNLGRQTDGLRRVVSNDAVFDRHFGFHQRAPFRDELIGVKKAGQEVEALYKVAICLGSPRRSRDDKQIQARPTNVTAAARSRILLLAELLRTRKLLDSDGIGRRRFSCWHPIKGASTNCYVAVRRRS